MASSDWLRSSGLLSALSTQDFFHFTALQLMELIKLAQFKRCWTGSFIVAFSSCMKNIAPSWFQIRFVICANNYCTFLINQIFKFKNLPKQQDSNWNKTAEVLNFHTTLIFTVIYPLSTSLHPFLSPSSRKKDL